MTFLYCIELGFDVICVLFVSPQVVEAKQKVSELKGRVEGAKKERDDKDQARKDAEELERKMLDVEAEQKKEREQSNKDEAGLWD